VQNYPKPRILLIVTFGILAFWHFVAHWVLDLLDFRCAAKNCVMAAKSKCGKLRNVKFISRSGALREM